VTFDPNESLSELSTENREFVQKAIDSGNILSLERTLAFALASAREGGKLTDRDIKAAQQTIGGDQGSLEQFVARLSSTRNV